MFTCTCRWLEEGIWRWQSASSSTVATTRGGSVGGSRCLHSVSKDKWCSLQSRWTAGDILKTIGSEAIQSAKSNNASSTFGAFWGILGQRHGFKAGVLHATWECIRQKVVESVEHKHLHLRRIKTVPRQPWTGREICHSSKQRSWNVSSQQTSRRWTWSTRFGAVLELSGDGCIIHWRWGQFNWRWWNVLKSKSICQKSSRITVSYLSLLRKDQLKFSSRNFPILDLP